MNQAEYFLQPDTPAPGSPVGEGCVITPLFAFAVLQVNGNCLLGV